MSKLSPKVSTCPSCNRAGMQRVMIDVETSRGLVADVAVDVCPHCGEQLFDSDALRQIEAGPEKRSHKRKPASSRSEKMRRAVE